ncbi:hypothetical protein F7331_20715 [Salmonella enterica]|nr:hypothetical protein [Salmonella enterica]
MAKNFVAGASHPGQMEREGVTSAPRKVHSGKQAAEVAAGVSLPGVFARADRRPPPPALYHLFLLP